MNVRYRKSSRRFERGRFRIVSAFLQLCAGSLILLLGAGPAVRAQTETGRITGLVRDARGDVVARAALTATSVATGAERTATTTDAGVYTIANLQPGVYDVRVEAPGFAASTQRAQVSVGRPTPLEFTLDVGGASETIDVVAGREGLQVNTQDPTVATTITETQIKELPTLDRDPYSLVRLAGNVSPIDPSGRGAGVAVNGQRATSTNVLLDGGANNNEFTGSVGQNVPLDSVQEFTVLTGTFSAEFGRAGGGVVNVATKAGSNEFHGTVYEFNRNSALASARFEDNAVVLAAGRPPIRKALFNRNQFGFSVGGPVLKDRLMFFGSAEWYRIRSTGTLSTYVATPELVAASSPATREYYSHFALGPVVLGRLVTVGQTRRVGDGAFRDLPADLPAFRQVYFDRPVDTGPGAPIDSAQLVTRVDWNVSDRTAAYVRFASERRDPLLSSTSPYTGEETAVDNRNYNVLGSVTRVLTPRLVSQTKFVYNRLLFDQEFGDLPVGPALDGNLSFGLGSATIPRFRTGPFAGPQNLLQFYEDVNYTVGAHALRFGGSLVRILDNRSFGNQEQSKETLGFAATESINNFVLGRVRSFGAAVDPQGHLPLETVRLPLGPPSFTRNYRYNEFALYLTDGWKARPRLTLTLGLRYEYFGVQHNTDRSKDSNFYLGDGANAFERIRNGRVLPTGESPVGGFYEPDRNNFGPRVGVAWDAFGDGKTSLRAGYGLGYERNFGGATINALINPPNYASITIQAANVGLPFLPIYSENYGPFSGTGTARLPRATLRYLSEDLHNAYAHNWSASVQRELFGGSLFSVTYAGSKGVDLYSLESINSQFSGPVYLGVAPGRDPNNPTDYIHPIYNSINARRNAGFSNHHSLTVGFDGVDLGGTGLRLTSDYTYGHTIDNLSSTLSESGNNFNLGLLDPFDPELDKGNSDFDVRHRFVTSGIWNAPFGRDAGGWRERLLGGWEVAYILEARTGGPFSIFDSTNSYFMIMRMLQAGPLARSGERELRPVENPDIGNQYVYIDLTEERASRGSYYNPAATAAASRLFGEFTPVSDFGPFPTNMTARNAFRRPGFWNLDLGLYKNVSLTERASLQLRVELYNALNHANLDISENTDVASARLISAAFRGRRQIQLAAKLRF